LQEIKNTYEAVIIFSLKSGEEVCAGLVQKFKDLISTKATLESTEEWGKRKFAYPIAKQTEGYYVLFNFASDAGFPAELDRLCRITDGIVRSLVIKKEKDMETK
jgi:small subunit ribosomal protein S6